MNIRRFIRFKIRPFIYKLRTGIETQKYDGSMMPIFQKGEYVSVFKKGNHICIQAHHKFPGCETGTIRLIPYQPNHGVMIEFVSDQGKIEWRTHCSYKEFYLMGIGRQESG